jgi:hypothetical protein
LETSTILRQSGPESVSTLGLSWDESGIENSLVLLGWAVERQHMQQEACIFYDVKFDYAML